MSRIVVTGRVPDAAIEKLRLEHEVDAWPGPESISPEELLRRVAGADAILSLLTERVDGELLDAAGPQLKVVANVAVGYDNIDVAACRERGVVATNTPGVLTEATADIAFGLLLMATTILALGNDLPAVWSAPTTTDKDRKRLLRSLLDEVNVSVCRDHTDAQAELVLRWKGGAITDLRVPIRRKPPNLLRTDEDTVDLVRRLAAHYPDATIAHILNRQGRRTARGLSFTAGRVQSLRHHYDIACHTTADDPQDGELLTVTDAADELSLAPSTLHRWLADGFIAGEQLTPGAPWRIRLTDDIRNLFVDNAPDGWLAMLEATLAYGVSRQTIMQRVKRGELKAVHLRTGRRKGLRIQPPPAQEGLF